MTSQFPVKSLSLVDYDMYEAGVKPDVRKEGLFNTFEHLLANLQQNSFDRVLGIIFSLLHIFMTIGVTLPQHTKRL